MSSIRSSFEPVMGKVIVALLLLLAAAGRNHEDTGGSAMWRRIVEPRLSATRSWKPCIRKLSPGHAVIDARCETPPLLAGRCDEVVNSREEADRMLVAQPLCTDAAIAALENFARAEPAAMSDLAGADYVRAPRKDHPSDLPNA